MHASFRVGGPVAPRSVRASPSGDAKRRTFTIPSPVAPVSPRLEPTAETAAALDAPPDHELTPEEAAENPAIRAAVQRLDDWATSALHLAWTRSSSLEEQCFDAQDEAIACTGAVHRRKKHRKISKQATLTNSGTLPLDCWPVAVIYSDERYFEHARVAAGQSTTPLPPGQSVVFPKVESSEGQTMFAQSAVICSIPTALLAQYLGVDLSPVAGRASGSLLVITATDSYEFTSADAHAPGLFEWFENDVLLK